MKNKQKQSNKTKKTSKLSKVAAKPEDETDMATAFSATDAPQAIQAIPDGEISTVELQDHIAPDTPFPPVTESGAAPKTTRSDAAKANIKQGLKQHAIAGRPTKAQLVLVIGTKGYAMTWAQRNERFGIIPETFQAALAKGVPAIRLGPGAQTVVEKAKETA